MHLQPILFIYYIDFLGLAPAQRCVLTSILESKTTKGARLGLLLLPRDTLSTVERQPVNSLLVVLTILFVLFACWYRLRHGAAGLTALALAAWSNQPATAAFLLVSPFCPRLAHFELVCTVY